MYTTAQRQEIISLLAEGKPTWYVAAVTKSYRHDVHQIGTEYGYPDRGKLRQAVSGWAAVPDQAA